MVTSSPLAVIVKTITFAQHLKRDVKSGRFLFCASAAVLIWIIFHHVSASKLVPLRNEVRVIICACRAAQETLVKTKPLICGNGFHCWKNVCSQFYSTAKSRNKDVKQQFSEIHINNNESVSANSEVMWLACFQYWMTPFSLVFNGLISLLMVVLHMWIMTLFIASAVSVTILLCCDIFKSLP